jgi:hypothetical protein
MPDDALDAVLVALGTTRSTVDRKQHLPALRDPWRLNPFHEIARSMPRGLSTGVAPSRSCIISLRMRSTECSTVISISC